LLEGPYFINAFTLPDGHVYVGAGLLSYIDSEDELAAVMGHEIEHIDHSHCAERVQQEQALHKIPFGGLIALPIEVFEAGYSKDQELAADREGTRVAVATGYSANGAIRMFETFDRLFKEYQAMASTPQQEMSQVAQQKKDISAHIHCPLKALPRFRGWLRAKIGRRIRKDLLCLFVGCATCSVL
jgi:predicted Zn-dependent protease